MQRRDFIKTSILGTGILMGSNIMNANPSKIKKYNLTFEYEINFESANDVKIWIPMPSTTSFQKPSNIKIQGSYDTHKVYIQDQTPVIYAQYSKKPKNIFTSVDVLVLPNHSNEKSNHLENFLQPTRYIRTDGMIEKVAKTLNSGNEKEKIAKIYKWSKENIDYENAKDIARIRTIVSKDNTPILSGENISINTVFVSLCRACGIPAREAVGLDTKTHTTLSKAEAYINNTWNQYDPLAVIKNPSFDGFEKWQDNFILLNYERDMKIQNSIVSLFDNAFATIDGDKLKYYENKNFIKNITIKTLG
ncbi:hypothetical protein BKH42_07925 [Helicobacter sp. 13S00482-2]|uniref:transglutaminase-like domain-containing protein n=1 Tax=Helicobacter sp. 13S00482-2 TaxID=1476200 RepID=UPI000BA63534|nr:transglutaminase-like domain-containing protein [Helicobacter sp. 13S00482-2]PAF53054.1 hypothetical protein BKH42_07925 [Helicobacter sp. 13S00482-2]